MSKYLKFRFCRLSGKSQINNEAYLRKENSVIFNSNMVNDCMFSTINSGVGKYLTFHITL